ncbi:hypothetical protein RGQ29_033217 [Quercus rubra]|uniref:Uncharacterized protein n=1 Tax=Quercus rubra TaxID=3512 RepID=A0AAN7DTV5_QUERU|nr:hypothetical protein RGQ29_033217 [Quercus rubra]KAK4541951.1 hypothetical protein RGQ29_033217 [Quercus rubra]KAK4541952.1 hypothetical protein RGQ29_033217 [Quercus rubra]
METLSLSYSHSHASSILYTYKPLTATNQAFPLFLLPCTRSHSTNHLFCSSLHLHRPSPLRPCHASATPGPPQDSDPPPGLAASLSKFQDRVQIFLAVLFWMSLFFWASAWDGRDRPNKGSRFRR